MKNLLVTGGAGFIGSNFVQMMLNKYDDLNVVVFDKLTYAGNLDNLIPVENNPHYYFYHGDICHAPEVDEVMQRFKIDTIVNFAAETHVDRSLMEPGGFIQTDVYGTFVLLEAAKKYDVERYHQISSVTGDTPILVRDEETGAIALRPIESLDGEELTRYSVLTMMDDYRVTFRRMRSFIKHLANDIYEITYNGGGRIRATASHSVFVFENGEIRAKPSSELKVGDLLVTYVGEVEVRQQPHIFYLPELLADYDYQGMDETLEHRHTLLRALSDSPMRYTDLRAAMTGSLTSATAYRTAERLAEDGYLEKSPNDIYTLTAKGLTEAIRTANQLRWDLIRRKLHIERESIPVTPLLMEVFGCYLAEGHCSHTPPELNQNARIVTFTLGKHEPETLETLLRCAREELGIEPYVQERDSSIQVTYRSYWVHLLFCQFGATAETKCLPAWMWTQPRPLIEAFLRGYEGDAAVKQDGRRYFTTINRELAENLVWLARMNDINCLLSTRHVQQIKGKIPPGITVTRKRRFYDLQITAENFRPGESKAWRTPMGRCLPTQMVVNALGCYQRRGVKIAYKSLVGKDKAQALAATFEEIPKGMKNLLHSPIGVAKIKAIRRVEDVVMVYDVSVPGNERFFGGNVPILLHNTDEVYGEVLTGRSVETDPLQPRSPYSAAKAGGDLMCLAYYTSFGVPVTLTRGSNNIGPYQYPEKVVPVFVTNAIDSKPLPLYGDGRQMRDYQYVLDHCEGIEVVLRQGQPGQIYNLGTGVETTNIEMARLVLNLLNKPDSLIQPITDRPGHDRRYALDCGKIQALGWRSAHSFEQAIEATVKWYVDNEWWWRKIKSGQHYQEYYQQQYAGREIKN